MVVSFAVAVAFKVFDPSLAAWQQLLLGVAITTVSWVGVTLLTPPADEETLERFCRLIDPGGRGWRAVYARLAERGLQPAAGGVNVPRGLLCMLLGCLAVYAVLFSTGAWLYGDRPASALLAAVAILAAFGIVKLKFND